MWIGTAIILVLSLTDALIGVKDKNRNKGGIVFIAEPLVCFITTGFLMVALQ
jgi:hypothetical protein